jgi:hypothetical protein
MLAIQAIKKNPKLSIRRAALIYTVFRTTLQARLDGRDLRRDILHSRQNLTKLEKSTIIQRIIELNSQAFSPRLYAIENMANRLLRDRDTSRVSKNWAFNFVKRQP